MLELLLQGHVGTPGGNIALVEAWLDECARAGQRPPPSLVVPLLELGSARMALRPMVATVTGSLSQWLGAQNQAWSWIGATSECDFATASRYERAALLRALRSTDPTRARVLIESTWSSEPAAERAALIDALASGLSDEDEPFLEAALDDRSATAQKRFG